MESEKIKVLIGIDLQNDFIDGSLANKEAQSTIPNIVNKIKQFNGDAIFLTQDTHFDNYLNTSEGKKLPIKHCVYKTNGWNINREIQEAIDEKIKDGIRVESICKPTFGSIECLPNTGTFQSLPELVLSMESGIEKPISMEIEICGFCTDICVVSNALILKAYTYDFAEITVDSKCCAGVTPEKHEAALETMRSNQINVI